MIPSSAAGTGPRTVITVGSATTASLGKDAMCRARVGTRAFLEHHLPPGGRRVVRSGLEFTKGRTIFEMRMGL